MSESIIFAIQAAFKNPNPTLRLLCILSRFNYLLFEKNSIKKSGEGSNIRWNLEKCTCALSTGARIFKLLLLRDMLAYNNLSFIIFTVSLIIQTKSIQLNSTNSREVENFYEGE